MKILVLSESLRINETSSGIVSATFIQALAMEHAVTCLYTKSFKYSVSWFNNVTLKEVPVTEFKPNALVASIPKFRGLITNITGIHAKDQHQINTWAKAINNALKKETYDLIITLGSGTSFFPHYAMLEVKTNTCWLANFHDPYPMSLYPAPYKQKRTRILYKQEKFTKIMMERADYISFPSLYLKEWMANFFPVIYEKSLILPHVGMSLSRLPSNEVDSEVNLDQSHFNLLHAGTLLGPRKVAALFKALERFVSDDDERKKYTRLSVLGQISEDHNIIRTQNSENIQVITKRVSYQKSLELAKQSSVCIVIEADAEISPFMPGKLADLIYLEKPILALTPKKSETLRILGSAHKYHARVHDEEEILQILLVLWNDWKDKKLKLEEHERLKAYISPKELNKAINTLIK